MSERLKYPAVTRAEEHERLKEAVLDAAEAFGDVDCRSGCLRNHGCPHSDLCDCACTCGAEAFNDAQNAYRRARAGGGGA